MNGGALGMAAASFVVVLGTWIAYFAKIPAGKVPARPIGSVLLQWLGIVLALAAVAWSIRESDAMRPFVVAPASLAVMMGAFFLWLLSQRRTPIGDLRVKVGDGLLPFEASTSAGERFHTEQRAGKRTLLKFFRGGW